MAESPKPADNGAASKRLFASIALSITLVPLSPLFYYLPYLLRGRGKYAFYEFGGYFKLYYITPGIGVAAGTVYLLACFLGRRRSPVLWYVAVATLLLLGFMITGLFARIPDFGETQEPRR
jgi:hypothetical protein